MAEIRRIEATSTPSYASCDNIKVDNTIEIERLYINDQLTELVMDAFTCGIFTEVRIWIGDAYINDEEPLRLLEDKIDQDPCAPDSGGVYPAGCDEGTRDKSILRLRMSPSELNMNSDVIDDFIVVGLTSKRCWPASGGDGSQEECFKKDPGPEPVEPINPDDPTAPPANPPQTVAIEEARVAVASYATIYPALIHKIMSIDGGCASCSEMNDALTMDMLIKACTIYLTVDRVEEAWEAYSKARQMSQDYEDLFRKGPTACQTFGGIGCWYINKDFVVSMSVGIRALELVPSIPI